jgi:dolichol-phosphate mannosyltransferase
MRPAENSLLSVVIPSYCEGSGVVETLAAVTEVLRDAAIPHELIVIDDGSTDDTWSFLERACATYPRLRAIRFSRNFGKEASIWAGLRHASGGAVLVMDADLQHPPERIPEMYRIWRESRVDVVEAVKTHRGREPLKNRVGARLFYALMNRLSGFDLDRATDFKLLDRRAVDLLLRLEERNLFFRGIVAWMGFERAQVTFSVPERTHGRSKWTFVRLAGLFTRSLTAFSTLPLQLITLAGALFLLFSLILGTKVFLQWWMGEAVEGFTTVILLLEIIGSLLMLSLGILGTYLARIYEEVKRRPLYVEAAVIASEPTAQPAGIEHEDAPAETRRPGPEA